MRKMVEACQAAGFNVTSNVIENIEGIERPGRPRRPVTVDELMALAYVLDVSPLVLLFPADRVEYPLTSTTSADLERVYRWLVGRARRPGAEAADPPDMLPLTPEEEETAMWWIFRQELPWIRERFADLKTLSQKLDYISREISNEFVNLIADISVPGSTFAELYPDFLNRFPALQLLAQASEHEDFMRVWPQLSAEVRAATLEQIAAAPTQDVRFALEGLKALFTMQDETESHLLLLQHQRGKEIGASDDQEDSGG